MRAALGAEHYRNTGHAFASVDADLDRPPGILLRHDRGNAIFEKIDAFDRLVRIEQRRSYRQRDWLKMWFKQGVIGRAERTQ